MPIKIPNDLPATATLQSENIFVMTETRALTQDIRPLEILILNLMPTKIDTETQFARLLGNTPLQVRLSFLHTKSHIATHVSKEHLFTFYKTFDEVRDRRYDGMIITGAPVEHLPFEKVEYWQELCDIMEWSKTHVHSTLHICWGAQAGLYYHYGIQKHPLPEKLFGVFAHRVEYKNPILLRGFDDVFMVPHSRHTTVLREDIEKVPELKIAAAHSSDKHENEEHHGDNSEGDKALIPGGEHFRSPRNEERRDAEHADGYAAPVGYFEVVDVYAAEYYKYGEQDARYGEFP